MAKDGGNKKRFQYCYDPSRQGMLYIVALQGHSGRNFIDLSLQVNVFIPNDFLRVLFTTSDGAINSHSIMNSGLIPGGQNLSTRQTIFFTFVIFFTENTKIQRQSTWKHRVLHNTCRQRGRNIKTRCIWSRINLLKRKEFISIRRDRTSSSFTIHS